MEIRCQNNKGIFKKILPSAMQTFYSYKTGNWEAEKWSSITRYALYWTSFMYFNTPLPTTITWEILGRSNS